MFSIVTVQSVTSIISLVPPPGNLLLLENHVIYFTGVTKTSMTLIFVRLYYHLPFLVSEIFDDVEDMACFTSKLLNNIID